MFRSLNGSRSDGCAGRNSNQQSAIGNQEIQDEESKTMRRLLILPLLLLGSASFAQTGTDMVEVEPIKCWWRTSTSAVRSGEPFTLTLTCAVVETETNKVVPDFSKLDPTVVQLPPFEVLGGTHPGDLVVPGKRFFQYDYRLRLIAEDAFGNDVGIPPMEISYRIE